MSTTKHQTDPEELDDEALFASLENEDDSSYRASRIEQLNAEFASAQSGPGQDPSSFNVNGNGGPTIVNDNAYPTITTDKAVLDFATNTHRCVVHFAHPDFARCGVMDEQIRALASRHYEVRFARVDVRDTPFIVEKLKIRVLPCVIGFKDGVAMERVVGFEGLGSGGKDGADRFSIAILEKRLLYRGVLVQSKISREEDDEAEDGSGGSDGENDGEGRHRNGPRRAIRSGGLRSNRNDDDDDDWD